MERTDLLALVCDVCWDVCYFRIWYPGTGVVLDCMLPYPSCYSNVAGVFIQILIDDSISYKWRL